MIRLYLPPFTSVEALTVHNYKTASSLYNLLRIKSTSPDSTIHVQRGGVKYSGSERGVTPQYAFCLSTLSAVAVNKLNRYGTQILNKHINSNLTNCIAS